MLSFEQKKNYKINFFDLSFVDLYNLDSKIIQKLFVNFYAKLR